MYSYSIYRQYQNVSRALSCVVTFYPTKKQMEVVDMLASSLREMCVKSFTDKRVITLKYKKLKVTKYLKVYTSKG